MIKKILCQEFVKYLIMGGCASLVYLVAANLAFCLRLNELTSTLVGYSCSIITGYILQMKVTFKIAKGSGKMFGRFLALSLIMFIYSEAITYGSVHLQTPYWAATLFIVATIPVFSYPLQKFWVYK